MSQLFDSQFLRRLERIRRHALQGRANRGGDRPSSEAGEGVEFQDFRGYAPGDDLRDVDWNAFARLGKLFRKRYRKEEGEGLAIVLDLSSSMGLGEPAKERQARLLAGGLGALALAWGSRVHLFLAGRALQRASFEGKNSVGDFFDTIEQASCQGGKESLMQAAEAIESLPKTTEIFVISDCQFSEGPDALLAILARWRIRGHPVELLQIAAQEERDPFSQNDAVSRWQLRDVETGESLLCEGGKEAVQLYAAAWEEFLQGLSGFSRRHGIGFEAVGCEESFDEPLLRVLQRESA